MSLHAAGPPPSVRMSATHARLASVPVLVPVRPEPWTRRVGEVAAAVVLVILLAPVLLAIALLVLTTSQGPVLFRHTRIGLGGRPFEVLKFRTMHVDAEARAAELLRMNTASGPLFKIRHDPRITPVGRWLRRLSLDELPQLWNVLNGTMSLVGPRPSSPPEVARFAPHEHRRHAVRPGLTGLAQINGRSDLPWEKAIRLDLHYVEHQSLRLDLAVLLRTVPAVLSGRGAY
ncbi:sugar transferase [Nocardioides vastitatis]